DQAVRSASLRATGSSQGRHVSASGASRIASSSSMKSPAPKPIGLSSMQWGKKKAGEYSEEDTHRPAHHLREEAARRTFGRVNRAVGQTPPKRKRRGETTKVPQLDTSIVTFL